MSKKNKYGLLFFKKFFPDIYKIFLRLISVGRIVFCCTFATQQAEVGMQIFVSLIFCVPAFYRITNLKII